MSGKHIIFADNDSSNWIKLPEDVYLIKVDESFIQNLKSGKLLTESQRYWRNHRCYMFESHSTLRYAGDKWFDPKSGLTIEQIDDIKSQIRTGACKLCILDWDRTITMTEGVSTYCDRKVFEYMRGEEYSDYRDGEIDNRVNISESMFQKYFKTINTQAYLDHWHLTGMNPDTIPIHLMGGKHRGDKLAELFNMAIAHDVKFVIITNNQAGNIMNTEATTFHMRNCLHQIGVNIMANRQINIVYGGSNAKVEGGMTKQEFIKDIIEFSKEKIYNVDDESSYVMRAQKMSSYVIGVCLKKLIEK